MKKVFILTNFNTYLKSFSPIIVVGEQLKMLQRSNEYEPILIAAEGWEPPVESVFGSVQTELMLPFSLHSPTDKAEGVEELVDLIYDQLDKILPDGAIVLTHDLIFLPDYTVYNLAARKLAATRQSIKWVHWIHSATNPQTVAQERNMFGDYYGQALNSKFPNSLIAYPNSYDKKRVAASFNFEEDQIIEVPHSTDPTEGMHPLVQRLYDQLKLGEPEVLIIYPCRLDRGKSVDTVVRYIAGCRRIGLKAQLIVCDFQSTGGDKAEYREDLKKLASELDVSDRVTFLSEFDDLASMEVSHDIILDLFSLSNVFIMPSKSETYSLVTQEAMMRGNHVIMNHDFAPFRQIFGEAAIYRRFDGANISDNAEHGEINITLSDPVRYYEDLAKELKYWLENDRVLKAKTWVRTKRNPDYIFRNYIEPIILALQNEA